MSRCPRVAPDHPSHPGHLRQALPGPSLRTQTTVRVQGPGGKADPVVCPPGLPVVEGGAAVLVKVKVKGVLGRVPGHSTALRTMVPLSLQMAIRQAPSPSVVL